ncbi:MAG: hypothetical protein A3J70_05745, partial [Elusimicrobia bacterium RIFCSPHIGHO2_02_FULL_61_10]
MTVASGGTLDMGTEASPIPTGTTAHLVLAYGSGASRYGLTVNNGGNFTVRGATKTPYGFALANILAADTSLTIAASSATGWQAGDVITIGPTTGNGVATTSTRTITSITGTDPLTINWADILGTARTISSTSPIVVANLTRNVLVRSSGTDTATAGTGSTAYIRNLAQNANGFILAYGEFAYLGRNTASQYGITLDNANTLAAISNSTIRHGYRGISAVLNADGNSYIGNIIFENGLGLYLEASANNLIKSNIVHANSGSGISLQGSPGWNDNNTIAANYVYSNASYGINTLGSNHSIYLNWSYSNSADGILLSAPGSILAHNKFYRNANSGVQLNSVGTLIGNETYANAYGLATYNEPASRLFADSLGYGNGKAQADAVSELFIGTNGNENLTMKGVRINPSPGFSTTNLNAAGKYVVSYNQDYATGTVRLWGDYTVSGSTLTLDYASQLYTST